MEQRKLGTQDLEVSAVGLGCMGRSAFYGETDAEESVAAIQRAPEIGGKWIPTRRSKRRSEHSVSWSTRASSATWG